MGYLVIWEGSTICGSSLILGGGIFDFLGFWGKARVASCFNDWGLYLTVILRGRAGYELIYITNEAVGKSEKNNCFSKFSSSPITGNCHSTHLFPLHETYSENIT